jgi:thiamine biosynthesis lipoprotein
VGIQKPTETKEGAIATEDIMELQDIAVATSGNYRNYVDNNGKRVGHTINPHTGYPAVNHLLSATVMASNCTLADAYATAIMVMNETQTQEFLDKNTDIKVYFIRDIRDSRDSRDNFDVLQ